MEEVNRYRPGRIILLNNSLATQPVQAYLSLDRLEDLVPLLQEVYGASVRTLPGNLLLIS